MLTLEIKICQTRMEKENKDLKNYYYYRRKNLLNHLVDCAENLENDCINK